jgi:5-amino-6-(5-phosphoribosylamino)uracil reductase
VAAVTAEGRPYTLLSCIISLDGFLDDGSERRLMLSNEADLDRVDEVRAGCDAILVGAGTVRRDNPRLLVRQQARAARRLAEGRPSSPLKVTLTRCADLDPTAWFFGSGSTEKLVYCPADVASLAHARLGGVATVVDAGASVVLAAVCEDLYARGVRRLMVEGGRSVHTQFLAAGLADELQLAVAPFFVGDPAGTRFVDSGHFPWNHDRPARLASHQRLGDVVLLRYALSDRFQP